MLDQQRLLLFLLVIVYWLQMLGIQELLFAVVGLLLLFLGITSQTRRMSDSVLKMLEALSCGQVPGELEVYLLFPEHLVIGF
nr:hypothetical protein Iba_chr08cCG3220 [Ipomoea batatas]